MVYNRGIFAGSVRKAGACLWRQMRLVSFISFVSLVAVVSLGELVPNKRSVSGAVSHSQHGRLLLHSVQSQRFCGMVANHRVLGNGYTYLKNYLNILRITGQCGLCQEIPACLAC